MITFTPDLLHSKMGCLWIFADHVRAALVLPELGSLTQVRQPSGGHRPAALLRSSSNEFKARLGGALPALSLQNQIAKTYRLKKKQKNK